MIIQDSQYRISGQSPLLAVVIDSPENSDSPPDRRPTDGTIERKDRKKRSSPPRCASRATQVEPVVRVASPLTIPALITRSQVAEHLKVSERTVRNMQANGEFPPPDCIVSARPRWLAETVSRWIDGRGCGRD